MLICDEDPFDQAHFLEVLEHVLPQDFWSPMKLNPDAGYELLQAFCKVAERVSLAANRLECGGLAIFASGGVNATLVAELHRPTNAAGAVTVKRGTVVQTGQGGRRFSLQQDVVFGALDLGPFPAFCTAVAPGYEWNVLGQTTTPSGIVLAGEVDTVAELRENPDYGDPTIRVRQINFVTIEGADPMLDGLAESRGMVRAPGETDDSLSLRIRTLPDTISPNAVLRLLRSLLEPKGLPFDFIEVFEHRYQECWDAPSTNVGTPTYQAVPPSNPAFEDNVFAYDDERWDDRFADRWLDTLEYRGAFIVVLSRSLTLRDTGFAYDDPGTGPGDFHPAGGPLVGFPWRQTPAYDAPNDTLAYPNVYPPAYDGFDIDRGALYAAVYLQLQEVKAGGIAAIVETLRP